MGEKIKDTLTAIKKMKMNKRFFIVAGIFLLTCFCVISTFFLLFGKYNYVDRWFTFVTIVTPILAGTIGGWLGIETGKLRGGRSD